MAKTVVSGKPTAPSSTPPDKPSPQVSRSCQPHSTSVPPSPSLRQWPLLPNRYPESSGREHETGDPDGFDRNRRTPRLNGLHCSPAHRPSIAPHNPPRRFRQTLLRDTHGTTEAFHKISRLKTRTGFFLKSNRDELPASDQLIPGDNQHFSGCATPAPPARAKARLSGGAETG